MVFKPRTNERSQAKVHHDHSEGATPLGPRPGDADARLETEVADALAADGEVDAADIVVVVSQGRVHLGGVVNRAGEIVRAEMVAARVPGVTAIDNELVARD